MADIVLCPHCQTRVLPSGATGNTCPSCGRDTSTSATASDRLRVAKQRKLAPRPSPVTILAGSLIGLAIGITLVVFFLLSVPTTYDPNGGEMGRMSGDVRNLMIMFGLLIPLWLFNAAAFLQRWWFCRLLYLVTTPIWLVAPTVMMLLGGHHLSTDNLRAVLGMNLFYVPLVPMMGILYLYSIWALTRPATGRWLRGEAAPEDVAAAAKPAA